MRKTLILALLVAAACPPAADAALHFWNRSVLSGAGDYGVGGNWNNGVVPGNADLAVSNSTTLADILITSNQAADSLRLSDGGDVVQSAGTLTIANGVGPDNGLWVGEFGPSASTYTISGGQIDIQDPADGLMVGRGGGLSGTLTLNDGVINNTVGDTHIGLDGTALWDQSSGTFNGAGVHIGRFQSPTATANLSGDATWDVGLVLMSDGFLGTAVQSDLNVIGPDVLLDTQGLVMKSIANLTFDGAGGGVSTMDLNGGIFLLDSGELFLNNLPTAGLGDEIVLIDNIGDVTGPDSEFGNAPDGKLFGDWKLDYVGGADLDQVRLVSTVIPEPTAATLAFGLLASLAVIRRRA